MRISPDARDPTILLLSTSWFGSFLSSVLEKPSNATLNRLRTLAAEVALEVFGNANSYFDVDFSEQRQARTWQRLTGHVERDFKYAERESVTSLIALMAVEGRLTEAQLWGIRSFFLSNSEVVARLGHYDFPSLQLAAFSASLDDLLRQAFDGRDRHDVALAAKFPEHGDYLENRVASFIVPRLFFQRLASAIDDRREVAPEISRGVTDTAFIHVPVDAMLAEVANPSFKVLPK